MLLEEGLETLSLGFRECRERIAQMRRGHPREHELAVAHALALEREEARAVRLVRRRLAPALLRRLLQVVRCAEHVVTHLPAGGQWRLERLRRQP